MRKGNAVDPPQGNGYEFDSIAFSYSALGMRFAAEVSLQEIVSVVSTADHTCGFDFASPSPSSR